MSVPWLPRSTALRPRERVHDAAGELVRPEGRIGRDAHGAAELRDHVVDRRQLVDDGGERGRVRGVRVDDRSRVGRAVDGEVHRQLARRRALGLDDLAVEPDDTDETGIELVVVDGGRRDRDEVAGCER